MLSPVRARKSDYYRYRDSWKGDNFRKEPIKKEAKNWYQKGCKEDLEWLQGAIEKSPILLSQYWKNKWLDGTIIISYFDGSNNIFADCIIYIYSNRIYYFENTNSKSLLLSWCILFDTFCFSDDLYKKVFINSMLKVRFD